MNINLSISQTCNIKISNDEIKILFDQILNFTNKHHQIFILTDENIYKIYTNYLQILEKSPKIKIITIQSGEKSKIFQTTSEIINKILNSEVEKQDLIIGLGGGVITDLASFCASQIMRGIPLILIPTSLLAMADAAIGGKNAINTSYGKNLIGTYYFPNYILINYNFLYTLPEKEIRNGWSEVVKTLIIKDLTLINQLVTLKSEKFSKWNKYFEKYLEEAIKTKIEIVNIDPFEKNNRFILNLGHTIGHSIEVSSDFEISHGEAVAIGIIAEFTIADLLFKTNHPFKNIIFSILQKIHPDLKIPPKKLILKHIHKDKKNINGQIKMSLLSPSYKYLHFKETTFVDFITIQKVLDILENLLK